MEKQNKLYKHFFLSMIICMSIGLVGYLIYFVFFRPYETTDDAYVGGNYISVAAQISGVAITVNVTNNQFVKAGDLLFSIDPAPFQISVNRAQAQLDLMGNEVKEAAANVSQAEANLNLRNAEYEDAVKTVERIFNLVQKQVLPPQDKDDAQARLKSAEQNILVAKAMLQNAQIHLGSLGEKNEQIRIATANLQDAKLLLSYTKVYAPYDGQISNCVLNTGQYVRAGMPLFALISYDKIWVDANFKETQLQNISVGQKAHVAIDMYPNKSFSGEVLSISGATGTVFSLLPPQNATGNWVKVTQRVPVRIIINDIHPRDALHLGISATVSIKVK